jgi:hypothetical protein
VTATAAGKPLPQHGTPARYDRGCRQDCCRTAHNAAANRRRRLRGYGQWKPFTDAEPIRAHLRHLMSEGVGWKRIAQYAGLPQSTVQAILYGRNKRAVQQVRIATAEAILAVRPQAWLTEPDNKVIDPTGTRRRLEALACRGYSCLRVGEAIDVWPETIRGWLRGVMVKAKHARAVATIYRQWEMQNAEDNGSSALSAAKMRALAARRGWEPPVAWDPETIDDPAAVPAEWRRSGERTAEEAVEDAEWLHDEHGLSWDAAAAQVGLRRDTLHTYRKRVRERAAASAAP